CGQNVDAEFLDTQAYGEYPESKTFHTPNLGDEVFEIPPISLDPDSALNVGDVVSHFGELSDGSEGPDGSVLVDSPMSLSGPSHMQPPRPVPQASAAPIRRGGGKPATMASVTALVAAAAGKRANRKKDPKEPVKPVSAYALFFRDTQAAIKGQNPNASFGEVSKIVASMWDSLAEVQKQSVLVDSPMSLSGPSHMQPPRPVPQASAAPIRRGGGKPATMASVTALVAAAAGKRANRKKDPKEPVKPVSAYALFFRDTQAAIKGQNPNASFGEVSKIVASMWDSLAEVQKQVYKRKTEMAKKEYLHALAAYRANQMSQPSTKVMEPSPSAPPPAVTMALVAAPPPEENTITNICASNIILDVPEVTTRSRTGANKPLVAAALGIIAVTTAAPPPPAGGGTKIIISRQMLQGGGGQVVTVLPSGVRTLQPVVAARLPPPLQQMQNAPPPLPRLQQMAPAPPPLQMASKLREGGAGGVASAASAAAMAVPPPPLQIKIVPPGAATAQGGKGGPVIVTNATSIATLSAGTLSTAPSLALRGAGSHADEEVVAEVFSSEETDMEVGEAMDGGPAPSVCVRAGCNNPAVDSSDWDREYCSNECVADHCRDIFMAWCSIRSHNMGTVK
ncbi:hypothetical protein CRUP_007711, partial [Coryphaenoides rupestris]